MAKKKVSKKKVAKKVAAKKATKVAKVSEPVIAAVEAEANAQQKRDEYKRKQAEFFNSKYGR